MSGHSSSGSSPLDLFNAMRADRPTNGFLVILQPSNGLVQKTEIQHASIRNSVRRWNSTKLAPLVLICVVSLTMISSITIALTPSVNQMIKTALSRGSTEGKQSPNDLIPINHLLDEAITDPKPNKLAKG